MGQAELASAAGAAPDLLIGPMPTLITGTALLVDGGVVAGQRNGRVNLGQL
ncbi:MAG: hypothetical protein JWR37_4794 [Mycobacterium sp.]|jgi:hypothetical protein|nr:hypothetical protein [Mycobacterium sp.]